MVSNDRPDSGIQNPFPGIGAVPYSLDMSLDADGLLSPKMAERIRMLARTDVSSTPEKVAYTGTLSRVGRIRSDELTIITALITRLEDDGNLFTEGERLENEAILFTVCTRPKLIEHVFVNGQTLTGKGYCKMSLRFSDKERALVAFDHFDYL
jgi:hypothetical protein